MQTRFAQFFRGRFRNQSIAGKEEPPRISKLILFPVQKEFCVLLAVLLILVQRQTVKREARQHVRRA
tara:strand:- start:509 stop:709 length:201 start_codon:yes stop_codon:yes gene_type:complete